MANRKGPRKKFNQGSSQRPFTPSSGQDVLPTMYPSDLMDLGNVLASRYRFEGEAGRGKTGAAYKLSSILNPAHMVCLKTISPEVREEHARQDVADNISKEIEILRTLYHRCIPQIYEYSIDPPGPYYVCTFHPGETMAAFRQHNKRIPLEDSVYAITSLIDALEYLHTQSRAHCDLHSRNVLITENVLRDGILIIDYGSGHRASDPTPDTQDRGNVHFKQAALQGRYGQNVRRSIESDNFRSYDFAALGALLAQMEPCFFADAMIDQREAYTDYCTRLQQHSITEWGQAREEFRSVIDPLRLASTTRRLFLAASGRPLSIPLPVWGHAPVGDPILSIINTRSFQRLRLVKQLSFCDWWYPGATHTRFSHSLGVFAAAKHAIESLIYDRQFRDLYNSENIEAVLLAALTHDVGHYPFAHVIEQYVASRFPGDRTARSVASHAEHTIQLLNNSGEDGLATAISKQWGERVLAQTVKVLRGEMGALSEILDGPIDCDKIDYLSRDALHCGVAFGQGLDHAGLMNAMCCVNQGQRLGILKAGIPAVEGLMILQDQMLSSVYWHHSARGMMCMFHALLAQLIEQKLDALKDLVADLKRVSGETEALREVIYPAIKRQPIELQADLINLVKMHISPRFTDMYIQIAEYKSGDLPSTKGIRSGNIYHSIVADMSTETTSVPIRWDTVRELRQAFHRAFDEKSIKLKKFELVVDVPYGKGSSKSVLVKDGDRETPLAEVTHLKPTIFESPAAFLSPIRVFVSPRAHDTIGNRLDSAIKSAEEHFHNQPSSNSAK